MMNQSQQVNLRGVYFAIGMIVLASVIAVISIVVRHHNADGEARYRINSRMVTAAMVATVQVIDPAQRERMPKKATKSFNDFLAWQVSIGGITGYRARDMREAVQESGGTPVFLDGVWTLK